MPLELQAGLNSMWSDMLLLVGMALTAIGCVALVLCTLAGCLEFLHQRRENKQHQTRLSGASPSHGVVEATATPRIPRFSIYDDVELAGEGTSLPEMYDDFDLLTEFVSAHRLLPK